MKKTVLGILAAVCLLYTGLALAQNTLPADSVLISSQPDDGLTEERYWSDSEQTFYDLHFNNAKALVKLETERKSDRGSANVTLQESDVLALAQTLYPDASALSITLERDDGLYEYKVYLDAPGYQCTADFHPESGVLLESEVIYKTADADGLIGTERAKQIALEKAGGGTVRKIELERDDGRQVYEGEVVNGKTEYDFEIDANTGTILDWERDD